MQGWQQRFLQGWAAAFQGGKKPCLTAISCSVLALLLGLAPGFKNTPIDDAAERYFSQAITQATVAYATTRVINGSVSVVKESNLQLQPAGVGLSLALGQVLDPLHDMAERLSDVLVSAIVALGMQKLMYEISLTTVPTLLAGVLLLMAPLAFIRHAGIARLQHYLLKFAFLLLILRFFLPLSATINEWLYSAYFEPAISASKQALAMEAEDIQALADFSQPATPNNALAPATPSSMWQQLFEVKVLTDTANFLDEKSQQIKRALLSKQLYATQMIGHLLNLTYLYVSLFVIQVILLPLGLFYALFALGRTLLPNVRRSA